MFRWRRPHPTRWALDARARRQRVVNYIKLHGPTGAGVTAKFGRQKSGRLRRASSSRGANIFSIGAHLSRSTLRAVAPPILRRERFGQRLAHGSLSGAADRVLFFPDFFGCFYPAPQNSAPAGAPNESQGARTARLGSGDAAREATRFHLDTPRCRFVGRMWAITPRRAENAPLNKRFERPSNGIGPRSRTAVGRRTE